MKERRFELRCYLPDGRIAQVGVPLDIYPALAAAVGATTESLLKHRLYDAYIALEHHMQPTGPELPPELRDIAL